MMYHSELKPEFPAAHPPATPYTRGVKIWLIAGLVLIFGQVVIGGITRLTGSGLSITKWEIVMGTLPPLNARQWDEAFERYRATPQYQKINRGMALSEFKFIYFWEYFHRLWARLMGLVFVGPFAYFYFRGMLDRPLLKRLAVVILLAVLAASFGWIMVASGLVDRPWVNAYKLTVHLSLALMLFGYLLWTTLRVALPGKKVIHNPVLKRGAWVILIVLALQIILGGIMSGMKAGLFYPTWPDMNGEVLPALLFDPAQWNVENFIHYDRTPFMAALVQAMHRITAYILTIIVIWFFFASMSSTRSPLWRQGAGLLITMLIIQLTLGVLTVTHSVGATPVALGVLHQGGALLLLAAALFLNYLAAPAEKT